MSIAVKERKPKRKNKTRIEVQEPPRDVERIVADHVAGKPAELEPVERAFRHAEAPDAGMRSAEAPDAGYGRRTESSDWDSRGRS